MPLYKAVPPRLAKFGAKLLQPIVEPDRNKEKAIFKAMLNDKNPVYMRRSIEMIMRWERNTYRSDIIHIHGCSDHTIPARNVKADIWVKDGSHMMTLTRAAEISALLNSIL